jgi:hypothetical protein
MYDPITCSFLQGCGVRVGVVDLESESEGILGGVGVGRNFYVESEGILG